jgi:hypothetical protein
MRRKLMLLLPMLAALMLVQEPALAAGKGGGKNANRLGKTAQTGPTSNRTLVNVNNLAMWIYSSGASATHPSGNAAGLYFPRGTSPTVATIFQDGLVWGGRVNDGNPQFIRVGGQTFYIGTVPGAILSPGLGEDINDQRNVDRIWRVRRDFATADLRLDAAEFFLTTTASVTAAQIQQLRDIYREDWIEWPAHKGAPFYDVDGDGVYTPGFKEDGTPKLRPEPDSTFNPAKHADEPGYADGDQVVWLVANDLSDEAVDNMYGSDPIGMEMQLTLWAYRRTDALGNIIFKQFRVIYKGTATTPPNASLEDFYFCQFADPDNGSFGDDYVGSDTTLSLGFVYNSQAVDVKFAEVGLPPAAAGFDFFAGPLVPDPGSIGIFGLKQRPGFRNLPMSTFAFFAANQDDQDPPQGEYTGTLQWYNLLRGFRPLPESPPDPWRDPAGNVTKFRVPGDPVLGTGWLDANAGDRRMLLATGPFTVALGDTQETVVASISALGSDRLSSISVLKFYDRFAQEAFDNLFVLPKPPAAPGLVASEFDGQIVLDWGTNQQTVSATEEVINKGFAFEGYNVYQLPTAGAAIEQGIKLATFDLSNGVRTISQEVFDQRSGLILNLPVQFGRDTGITRSFFVTRDVLRDTPLINGQIYYFGVTAYSLNTDPDATLRSLESAPAVVTVVPQSPKPGVRFGDGVGQALTVTHTSGFSDAPVQVTVIDPTKTKNAEHLITIDSDGQGGLQWTWRNVSAQQDVLTSKLFGSADTGDPNDDFLFPIIDGLRVSVKEVAPGFINSLTRFIQSGNLWLESGGLWSLGGPASQDKAITTGEDLGGNYLGHFRSTFNAIEMVPVLLKFGPSNSQKAYRLRRTGPGTEYLVQDVTPTPELNVAAYDITNPNAPRQLTLSWRDQDNSGTWNPQEGDTGLEILFIHFRTYDPTMSQYAHAGNGLTPIPDEVTASDKSDVMYGASFTVPAGRSQNENDIEYRIRSALRLTANDEYTFKTFGTSVSMETAKQDVARMLNVFPNPYYGFNSYEQNQFTRFITFNHLPAKAIIRIFNLAGVLVRTLTKGIDDTSDAQFLNWNLQNESGLPVASGIYVARIECPDLGVVKDLKIAIIQEQQFLRNF